MDSTEKKKEEARDVVEGEAEQEEEEDTEESPQAEQQVIHSPAQIKLLDINSGVWHKVV